jgi:hypothetical protein
MEVLAGLLAEQEAQPKGSDVAIQQLIEIVETGLPRCARNDGLRPHESFLSTLLG